MEEIVSEFIKLVGKCITKEIIHRIVAEAFALLEERKK